MARIPEDIINDVRAKADIVSIIGQYIPLTKKGKNYVGLCPFHDDHNPSLSISSDKQIYKCFVCQAGGNVFTFVSEFEKIPFVDAVIQVAKEVNVDLSDYKREVRVVDQRLKKQFEVLDQANQFLKYQLQATIGLPIKDYLKQRGIDKDIIEAFEIGYDPDREALTNFLLAKKYDLKLMHAVNVVAEANQQNYDVFANRITFPIRNYYNQIIGFTARSLEAHQSKYINTATTDLYVKSEVLYNIYQAKEHAKRAGHVILVEGVMDVIAYYKAGIKNVVAPLGTALTRQQINWLKKISHHVILAFDGDDAGQSATQAAIDVLIPARFNVEVIRFNQDEDPDDVIEKQGKQALVDLVEKRMHWLEYAMFYYQSLYNLSNYNQKKTYVNTILTYIKNLQDPLDKQHFSRALAQITGFDEQQLFSAVTSSATPKRDRIRIGAPKDEYLVPIYEKEILAQMLLSKQAAMLFQDELGYLSHTLANECAMLLINLYRTRDEFIEIADIISKAQAKGLDKFLMSIMEWPLFPEEVNLKALQDAMFHVKLKVINDQIKQYKGLASQSINPKQKAQYIAKMIKAQQEIQELKLKEGVYDKN
ncbi:MAG: DNA primase [Erysipelothrix sp.]|nr:DNA primase [Erysipelothrix sp.]